MKMLKVLIFVSFEIALLQVSFWHMSNPWVMGWACWCACAHQALSVGIVTFFALASGAGRRGWGVAFRYAGVPLLGLPTVHISGGLGAKNHA